MSNNFTIEQVDHTGNDFETSAYIENGVIIYQSAGSSSAPPIIDKVDQDGNTIYLMTKDYKGAIRTADLRPCQQMISYADNTLIPDDVEIVIVEPSSQNKKR